MGIFRAATSALSSSLEVQWKELFVCDALPDEVIVSRGYKRISNRSVNDNSNDDTITHGSLILIADGQCAIVVSGGKVLASCMTPGEYTYEDPNHASGIASVLRETGRRFTFGGDAPSTHGQQRVYYINTREIPGNRFSGIFPFSFRVSPQEAQITQSIQYSGTFSFRVIDPVLFYRLVSRNVSGTYTRSWLSSQISNELQKSIVPSAAALSEQGLRPSDLSGQPDALCRQLRQTVSAGWAGQHGLELVSFGIDSFQSVPIREIQSLQFTSARREAIASPPRNSLRDQLMESRGSTLASAILGKQNAPSRWVCSCGTASSGSFCPECGSPRPVEWVCGCQARNKGRFCTNCGKKRPDDPSGSLQQK